MSMTAERWWVRLAARWLARIDGVSGQLRLALLGLTGVSTATLTLRQYGYGEYAWPFIGAVGVLTIIYTYFYTEGGVWNQTARDRADLSDNYSAPTMLLDKRIEAKQLALLAYVLDDSGRDLAYYMEQMDNITHKEWAELRDGVDVDEIESQYQ